MWYWHLQLPNVHRLTQIMQKVAFQSEGLYSSAAECNAVSGITMTPECRVIPDTRQSPWFLANSRYGMPGHANTTLASCQPLSCQHMCSASVFMNYHWPSTWEYLSGLMPAQVGKLFCQSASCHMPFILPFSFNLPARVCFPHASSLAGGLSVAAST